MQGCQKIKNMNNEQVSKEQAFVLWFDDLTKDDIPFVGGKNANLGEMYQKLTKEPSSIFRGEKISVPYGFAVTAHAYRYFIKENKLDVEIHTLLQGLDTKNIKQLEQKGQAVRQAILGATFPRDLEDAIRDSYRAMAKKLKSASTGLDVAVRSSATAEDLPNASFAGQQESYLNINGEYQLLEAIKKCIASLFTNRAISYRVDQNFDHFKIALSVAVQKMVRSDRGASGVMFTLDTESGFRDVVLINAAYGLGEFVVKGIVTPDEYMVFKPTLKQGFKSIISKRLGSKEKKLIYATEGITPTKEVPVPESERHAFVLNDEQVLKLSRWGVIIEEHYNRPMDIEWAYDSETKELFIVQARPETVQTRKDGNVLEEYVLEEKSENILVKGAAVGAKIGQGKAHYIKDASQISEFRPGEVLVTEITDPDWEPIMKMASAIVTNSGGRTSHAAIVSRELGIPAIVGTGTATTAIGNSEPITVSCAEGEVGKVYSGLLKFKINRHDLQNFKQPKTEIKMIVADPQLVFGYSFIPNRGVGLAREEFIISNYIKVHPNALLHFDTLKDENVKKQIEEITVGYDNKLDFYVHKLAYGIGILAAAFYPYEVILRFSDFKTNEYANLIGGREFEPHEENPMIGWRGASRYYDENFKDAFALECRAVKKVRDEMGLFNLKTMIPFCRTPEEGEKVLAEMAKNGLKRVKGKGLKDKDGIKKELEVWVMAEIPSNILQVDEFAALFDGFSIGSNDLTQLTLGLDRDSKLVAHIGNEKNKSVLNLIHNLILKAHAAGVKVGICGQGPSDFPELGEFLVKEGIDSISLNPDTVLKATVAIQKVEEKLGR